MHTIADRGSSKRQHEAGKEPKPVTPQSPKPGRSPLLRRNGSLGKGPTKTTVPQGFKLATEARSLIRPCGCGKDGVFSPHVHGQGHTHHKKGKLILFLRFFPKFPFQNECNYFNFLF